MCVPQGSILGPLLFLIYINDMKNAVKYSLVHHFADDTNRLCNEKCEKLLRKKLNSDLRDLYLWLCANRLSLNVDKTEFILFRPPKKTTQKRFTLRLNNTTIYESTKIKYLGVILDPHLSWKSHIYELRKKLSRALGILFRMKQIGSPKEVLLSIYYSLFQSHLGYGILVYGLANDDLTHKIKLLQKRAIRLISNAEYRAPTLGIFRELKILDFDKFLDLQLSLLMWEYDHRMLPKCFDEYFNRVSDCHNYATRSATKNKRG